MMCLADSTLKTCMLFSEMRTIEGFIKKKSKGLNLSKLRLVKLQKLMHFLNFFKLCEQLHGCIHASLAMN